VSVTSDVLIESLRRYQEANLEETYDETLSVVVDRVRAAGHLTKADIGSLVLWKRISAQTRWAKKLGNTPDSDVRKATGSAFDVANDRSRPTAEAGQSARWALNGLPGMSPRSEGALASSVLVACAPERMAVWDRRVKAAMELIGMPIKAGPRYYGRYLERVAQLQAMMASERAGIPTSRHVDLALWRLPDEKDLVARLV
jgi:hypothetical protein